MTAFRAGGQWTAVDSSREPTYVMLYNYDCCSGGPAARVMPHRHNPRAKRVNLIGGFSGSHYGNGHHHPPACIPTLNFILKDRSRSVAHLRGRKEDNIC